MEIKDLLVTPIWLLIIYACAFIARGRLVNPVIRKYFIPALTVRLIGAICVGLIYQYYYNGGDTFNFFTHGSHYIWEAWKDSPEKAIKLIFAKGQHYPDTFIYSSQIWYYRDLPSYFVVRIVAVLDLLTFHTYSATACLFASISFIGLWSMFGSFFQLYPRLHRSLAIAILFIPSVFFWGSGIMKDTLTLAAVAFIASSFVQIFYFKKISTLLISAILISFYVIYSIKIYILLCLIPAFAVWYFVLNISKLKSTIVRMMVAPSAIFITLLFSYLAIDEVSKDHDKYAIEKLSRTAKRTAEWINYVSLVEGGSGYVLGDFDYTTSGMIRKFPLAVNVALFRPYLWEVDNPVMLLASLESLALLIFTIWVLIRVRLKIFHIVLTNPLVLFALLFAISFAFAVGFSTYNFGSLVRYKIPLIPFYLSALSIINYENKAKNLAVLASTE